MFAAGTPDLVVRFRLNVLQGSRARALYERHGFVGPQRQAKTGCS
jgi:hypothetical protein